MPLGNKLYENEGEKNGFLLHLAEWQLEIIALSDKKAIKSSSALKDET